MNGSQSMARCPACLRPSTYQTNWEFSGLDDSVFNYTAELYECQSCGLVHIENITDEQLSRFYALECSYFEKDHFDTECTENLQKYAHYRRVITGSGIADKSIADIGCGRGGFLQWLKKKGWESQCVGVDIDLKSIPLTSAMGKGVDAGLQFMEGSATELPFSEGTQSLLTYFHVLEHIRDIDLVLDEAFRVLDESGHILIEVPDAERYGEYPIGPGFWISIREHIYHFSASALCHALNRHGFELVDVHRLTLPTPDFDYPSLMLLAQKKATALETDIPILDHITKYIHLSKKLLDLQAARVGQIYKDHHRVTFWGCSAELFSLLPLLTEHVFALCDSSPHKQRCSYGTIPIEDPARITKDGALIVAPYLHKKEIEEAALKLGWPETAIYHLE